ncbi:MAG: copper transporter, partial [Chitinophagales bacterium]
WQGAMVVTGGQDIPPGMVSGISLAGGKFTSTTIFLPAMEMGSNEQKLKLCDYYKVDHSTPIVELQKMVASSVAQIVAGNGDEATRTFLQDNNLVKFNGDYTAPIQGIVLLGGANGERLYYPRSIDEPMLQTILSLKQKAVVCETSYVKYSYMKVLQKFDISTIDDVDLSPGQVALIRSIEGETGDYGIKKTASKFMPSLPVEYIGGASQ